MAAAHLVLGINYYKLSSKSVLYKAPATGSWLGIKTYKQLSVI
jgi:hypothetical protein